jgi:hypothetical protein
MMRTLLDIFLGEERRRGGVEELRRGGEEERRS